MLIISSSQFVDLSSFVRHSSSVPLHSLSLCACRSFSFDGRVSSASLCSSIIYSGCFVGSCRLFPDFHPCFCLWSFLSSPSFSSLVSYLSLWEGVLRSIFSVFSFCLTVLGYFVTFVLPVLCLSSVFLCGIFCMFLHSLGVLPEFLPRLVSSGFVLTALVAALFPLCCSSPLCVLVVLLVSALGPAFASTFQVHLSSVRFFSFACSFILWAFSLSFSHA